MSQKSEVRSHKIIKARNTSKFKDPAVRFHETREFMFARLKKMAFGTGPSKYDS
jgi:hypothetical protein